jgi:transcriptional regulator with XRE-family HTH domain
MTAHDQVLAQFIDAWNAGRRPKLSEYLDRVPEGAPRDELADALETFLTYAETPTYSPDQRAAIRAEPAVQAVLGAPDAQSGLLGAFVRRLRDRAGLTVDALAEQILARTRVQAPDARRRTAGYLGRLEAGELDAGRLSSRLLDGLAEALGSSRALLEQAGAPGPHPAVLFRGEGGALLSADLDVLAEAAFSLEVPAARVAPLDDVDRLFLGGPEG